ncbi:MAG: radical SAM protein [Bryobacteraceae bacterium]|jgi:radical SAM superfamily enzyme YgiQ (UPF0313 family)
MKILLVSPCTGLPWKTPAAFMIPQLGLHILAGLTPPQHDVKIVEEEVEHLNLDEPCDLVGISCMTANAPRAYHLAHEFQRRGRKVVLGGVHPSILPEEAAPHADAVVVGEAEGVWNEVLADASSGVLRRRYHCPDTDLGTYIPMRKGSFARRNLFNILPAMTTRGCPYNCDFCCVSHLFGNRIRHVPVANVVRFIQETGAKKYLFLDDNIIGDPRYARELFAGIKPLGIKWVGQASVSFCRDRELMKLAAASGCGGLFFGVESVSPAQLRKMRKSLKDIALVEDAIQRVRDVGIFFHASLIFGFDEDTKAVFPETLEFLNRNRIGTATFNVLTPYPGTKVYEQFRREDRLLTGDWRYYDHTTVVFRPTNMSPYELQEGKTWVKREFSKLSSILRRLPANLAHPFIHVAMNLAIRTNAAQEYRELPRQKAEIFDPAPSCTLPSLAGERD